MVQIFLRIKATMLIINRFKILSLCPQLFDVNHNEIR